jgi:hypothetical protein
VEAVQFTVTTVPLRVVETLEGVVEVLDSTLAVMDSVREHPVASVTVTVRVCPC